MKIFKYELPITDRVQIQMHKHAQVLKVAEQFGTLCIWANCNDALSLEPRNFAVHGTGHPLPDTYKYEDHYVDSVVMSNGLVWHVFDLDKYDKGFYT
jgi:hypothetical protein